MNLNILKLSSIKARVTLFTLAIFVTSIWSLSFYASRVLHDNMLEMLSEQQFSTVSIVASNINAGLDDRLRSLENAAKKLNRPFWAMRPPCRHFWKTAQLFIACSMVA